MALTGSIKRTYSAWYQARARCTNPEHPDWSNYGGRGITMSYAWVESFRAFLDDMGVAPEGLSLDRIDNERGYYLDNCRWATAAEQASNRRPPSEWKRSVKRCGLCGETGHNARTCLREPAGVEVFA